MPNEPSEKKELPEPDWTTEEEEEFKALERKQKEKDGNS